MADIVIAAIGVAGYLKADMVKEGAVVIDVGECLLIVVMLVMFAKLYYFRVLYTHTTGKNACRYIQPIHITLELPIQRNFVT